MFIPKTNEASDIKWLLENLQNALGTREDKINLFYYMESATSLINLKEIIITHLEASAEKYNKFK